MGESRSRATLVSHRPLQQGCAPDQELRPEQEEDRAGDPDQDIADAGAPGGRRGPPGSEADGAVEDAVPFGGAFLAEGLAAGHADRMAVPVRMVRALGLFEGHGTLSLPCSSQCIPRPDDPPKKISGAQRRPVNEPRSPAARRSFIRTDRASDTVAKRFSGWRAIMRESRSRPSCGM